LQISTSRFDQHGGRSGGAGSPSKNMIAANKSVPLKVVFDSAGKSGRQNKTITITSLVRICSKADSR
jgi:hypothetical protein